MRSAELAPLCRKVTLLSVTFSEANPSSLARRIMSTILLQRRLAYKREMQGAGDRITLQST